MVLYTSIAIFLFFALSLIVKSGFSLGAALLFAGSAILIRKSPKPFLRKDDVIIIGVLFSYFVITALINLFHHASLSEYDPPLRFLLVIPVLLLLRVSPPDPRAIWGGLAVGAILAGIFTGWENIALGQGRAGGYTNPIQYGDISVLLGMLCLVGLDWAQSQRRAKTWIIFLLIGTVMGVLGAIFTGSRGSWISVPLCLIALCIFHKATFGNRLIVTAMGAIIFIFTILYFIPPSGVETRLELATSQTEAYFSDHESETSLGARLEMWRTGLMIAPEKPWLGWGKQGLMERVKVLAQQGKIDIIVTHYTHLHNEFIDALAKRGILGLLAVLGLYFIPLALFTKKIKSAGKNARSYALGGMLLCLCYVGFGISQAFLTHNNGVMMFAFTLVLLWSQLRHNEQQVSAPVE